MGIYVCLIIAFCLAIPGFIGLKGIIDIVREMIKTEKINLISEQIYLFCIGSLFGLMGICFFYMASSGFLTKQFTMKYEFIQLNPSLESMYPHIDMLYAIEWIIAALIFSGGFYISGCALDQSYVSHKTEIRFSHNKASLPFFIKEILIITSILLVAFIALKMVPLLP